jgi:hypothetical protein
MEAKEREPGQPVSDLFYSPGGQSRLFEGGWYCTCGGNPQAECEHITAAQEQYKPKGKSKPEPAPETS